LRSAGGTQTSQRVAASDSAAALGPQDLVVIALKGPALIGVAPTLAPLLGPATLVLPAMNGVPWWFLAADARASAAAGAEPLASVDPGGRVAAALPLERVLGCVVHLTCSSPAPGVVQHGFGERLIVGEPSGDPGAASPRTRAVCEALTGAGFQAEASADIRREVWYKLWGNMTMNPISAMVRATSDTILDDELVRAFMARVMEEAREIGRHIGCDIDESVEARMDVARNLGAFKTSMLQDAEAGRPLEIDLIVAAPQEIARLLGLETPNLDTLLGLSRLCARGLQRQSAE